MGMTILSTDEIYLFKIPFAFVCVFVGWKFYQFILLSFAGRKGSE
jgi:hypothetical protein